MAVTKVFVILNITWCNLWSFRLESSLVISFASPHNEIAK